MAALQYPSHNGRTPVSAAAEGRRLHAEVRLDPPRRHHLPRQVAKNIEPGLGCNNEREVGSHDQDDRRRAEYLPQTIAPTVPRPLCEICCAGGYRRRQYTAE